MLPPLLEGCVSLSEAAQGFYQGRDLTVAALCSSVRFELLLCQHAVAAQDRPSSLICSVFCELCGCLIELKQWFRTLSHSQHWLAGIG